MPRAAWRSCTTSCSTSGVPNACFWPCARSGPTRTSSPPSTTRRAPRVASRTATCTPRSCSACDPPRAPSARCFRSIPRRSSPSTCPGTTSSCRARAPGRTPCICDEMHGARLLLPQPVPLRLERPRPHAGRRAGTRSPGPRCASLFRRWRQWDWIAAQRVDPYVTNSQITQARVKQLPRPRRARHLPAGGDQPLRARPGGRPLPGALRADAAQADRRDRAGLQPSSGCRSWWWATARTGDASRAWRDPT